MNIARHAHRTIPFPTAPTRRPLRIDHVRTALAFHLLRDTDDEDDEAAGRMGLLDHLDELRTRIIKSCVAVAAGMVCGFAFVDRVVRVMLEPAKRALPAGAHIVYTRPSEGFSLYFDVALLIGVLVAAPYIMFQVWRFIAPALYTNEKKLVIPFVLLTTLGLVGGALFNHFVVFPSMMTFFGTFSSNDVQMTPRLEDLWDLYSRMLLGLCLAFQLPTLAFFLGRMRVITAGFLWRHFMHAVLAIFIAAAILTPSTDWWTQTVFAVPMIALYLGSIAIVWLVRPARRNHSTSQNRTTTSAG